MTIFVGWEEKANGNCNGNGNGKADKSRSPSGMTIKKTTARASLLSEHLSSHPSQSARWMGHPAVVAGGEHVKQSDGKSNCRSFDCAFAKNANGFAQDDNS
jgi:hypothetical protein